jgi:hypothetical protein
MVERRTTSVEDMYANRHRPYGQVRDGSHRRVESEPSLESGNTRGTAFNRNVNQDPEDKHDDKAQYANDVPANSWLRSDGARKPGFDASKRK